jgi:carnosine N-methyltransferase
MNHSLENEEEDKYFDEVEKANFLKVISHFKNYKKNSLFRIEKRFNFMQKLPIRQQQLLANYKRSLSATKQCVEQNNRVIDKFLSGVQQLFVNSKSDFEISQEMEAIPFDLNEDKVAITLKQIVRDWTDRGAAEREESYRPILDELANHFDLNNMEPNQYKVLLPGCGLGRLMYEMSLRGFYCEGNEFSLFMLIVSNFILNRCLIDNCHEIYPYCHQFVNNLNSEDPLISCQFPDVSPFQHPPKGNFF